MKKIGIFIVALLISSIVSANNLTMIKTVLFPFKEAIISSKVTSSINSYQFLIGEKFDKQSIIAELDSAYFNLELRKMQQQYNFAKNSYEDKKRLHEKKFISDYEFQRAEFELKMAEIKLEESKLNLSYCIIKAPFAGKIVEILTNEHETVRVGQNLFKIINDSSLLAIMNVPQSAKKLNTIGEVIKIKINNKIIEGRVYEVAPQADHRTGTVRIKVLIDNSKGELTSGMTGELFYDK